MAVERMHFVNIIGLIENLDSFVVNNIVPFDIQLVEAYPVLDSVKELTPFTNENPYENLLTRIKAVADLTDQTLIYDEAISINDIQVNSLEEEVKTYETEIDKTKKVQDKLRDEITYKEELYNQLKPLAQFDIQIDQMFHFDYMKFRFGKMPKESYQKLKGYMGNIDVIIHKVSQDEDNDTVYLMYFTPHFRKVDIDSLFGSLYFERIRLSPDIKGKPIQMLNDLEASLATLRSKVSRLEEETRSYLEEHIERLRTLYSVIVRLDGVFDVRHYAVHSDKAFYLTGWVPHTQLRAFKENIDRAEGLDYVIEEEERLAGVSPPTRLNNPWFFKPFEALVKMYGLPSYNELDPTIFLSISYLIFFGMMFGDLGQGVLIALAGYLIYRRNKSPIGKIAIYLGGISAVFGIVYGSVFGNEHLLRQLLPFIPMINPMDVKIELLAVAVGLGVVLIVVAMLLNIKNRWKNKEMGELFFGKNGIAGIIFYLSLIYLGLSVFRGKNVSVLYIVLLIVVPLILFFFAEPLTKWLEHKKQIFPKDKKGFVIESFFELVEILLSILSNTISFVRVGAFALNHVGFFLAFHKLSDMVGGSGSLLVMIFGNLLIIVLEGLIVSIQGLRLEYYELFSRFYEGNGKEFHPFRIKG